ncbi:MAG: ammonia channel protein [Elusimicrobia bacterium RIFOXYA1_FULL_47_7]|nr:MAG: ammonia channel protein [Elusimicrobia bacterium RIFOXYA12_FULL_49_49]OGS08539.1 MAG: ammonia channel protein [Elusimicrobia bacterium RIFOXYA1_FULL_47_7]OGS15012.1 MAG: ammonia channel protein [Elusimicrobia bacterium RIFOXYA2_FULL_47_53]OGS29356.1 MAG: ammonia channel protein [Elusimicrobia bacterium RIFOXYB2_FULL_46_23]
MNSGDTAFILLSAGLVMLMTPGLALFYGGMVRRKNVLSVLMQCFAMLCVLSIQWMLFGYSLSFAPGNGFIGGLQWFALNGVGLEAYPDYASTIPHQAFMIFQAMFAVITPALIIGAFAERMKFSAFMVFGLLWATLVYDPVAHWVWGTGGWLRSMGTLDFAGGIVVHTTAGIAALVMALVIGRRKGYKDQPMPPHSLTFTALGAALLWFGWFGFNAGSALSAGGLAVTAFVNTNAAAAAAGLTWFVIEWVYNEKPTTFGVITGSIAGLATVTPASGYITPFSAVAIGIAASSVCFLAVSKIKPRLGYDDSLDAFGVHGVGGILGTILAGVFALKSINPAGADGLLAGNASQLFVQIKAVGAVTLYTLVMTFAIYKFVDIILGIRVSEKDEVLGLDLTQHREGAYTVLE